MAVLRENEVELFGKRFPVYGPIQKQMATTFPGKMVVGDYTREDQVVSSSWVVSSMTGGLGVQYGRIPEDQDRYYIGTLDPRHKNQITLAPIVKQIYNIGPVEKFQPFNEILFGTIGTQIVRKNHDDTWTNVGPTLPAPAQGSAVYQGSLWFITLMGSVEYNGITETWKSHPLVRGFDMETWDNKLFYLTQEGEMYWSIDPNTNVFETNSPWTYGGQVPLPPGYGRQLIVYFDASGEQVLHVPTRVGLYAYDFDGYLFHATSLKHPVTVANGRGVGEWRNELKYPLGTEIYQFDYNVVQSIGPDKDDGLPQEYKGRFKQVVPGHAYYYAVMETEGEFEEEDEDYMDIEISMPDASTFIPQSTRRGIIFNSPGRAWHISYMSEDVGIGMGDAVVMSDQNTNRLYFSNGNGIFYTEAPVTLHNPLQTPFFEYQESGFIETYWFDAGWIELPKLALGLDIYSFGCQHHEHMRVYAAWDEKEEWEYIGVVRRNHQQFNIGQTEGRLFRNVKLRIEMIRGGNTTQTPVIRNIVFSFTRQPRKLWGWSMRIRLDEEYEGRTPTDMYRELMEIVTSSNAGEFIYKDEDDIDYRHRVLVSNTSTAETAGTEDYSQFEISVIQMDMQPYG